MSAQPRTQSLFQDDPLPQRGGRKPFAACWTADELAFADRMITWWRDCSQNGHTPSASKVRRNRFVAIVLYRWLNSPDNAAPKMTEDDVRIAIEAYSKSDYNNRKCEGRYLSFGDWMRGCPDNVDKELKRIGRNRGNNQAKENAVEVVRFKHWGVLARMATKNAQVLYEYAEAQHQVTYQDTSLDPLSRKRYDQRCHEEWLAARWVVLKQYRSLTRPQKSSLFASADKCFAAYTGRVHSIDSTSDRNLRVAMACSLLEKYKGQVIVAPPPEKDRT